MTTTSPEPTDVDTDAQPAGPSPVSPTGAVAAGLAVHGLDLQTARAVIDARARRRIRTRRGALAGVATVAALAVAVVVIPRDEPKDVIADEDRTTTTTGSTTTTLPPETVPVTAPAPVTTAVTTTVKKPVATLPPPPTTVPPTTLPPNQALTASLATPTTVAVGDIVTLEIKWSDPDMADPTGPRGTAVWGDLNVTTPISTETRPPCELPGSPTSGTLPLQFRYSRPGTYPVTVQLRTCDGVGAYAENQTLTTTVTVTPVTDSRSVVLAGPLGGPSPDGSTLTYTATTGPTPNPRTSPIQNLGLISTVDGAPVTVVVLPTTFTGSVRAEQAGVCQTGTIDLVKEVATLGPINC